MQFEFGIPKRRSEVNNEKYPNKAVLTFLKDEGDNKTKKVQLNLRLIEALDFEMQGNDTVNFAFTMEGEERVVYFGNTTNIENSSNISLTKQGTFANKRMYEYVAKLFNLDVTKDNELEVVDIENGIGKVFILNTTDNQAIEKQEEDVQISYELTPTVVEDIQEITEITNDVAETPSSLDY